MKKLFWIKNIRDINEKALLDQKHKRYSDPNLSSSTQRTGSSIHTILPKAAALYP